MNLPPTFLADFVLVILLGAAVVAIFWVLDLPARASRRRARRPTPQPIQLPRTISIPTARRRPDPLRPLLATTGASPAWIRSVVERHESAALDNRNDRERVIDALERAWRRS